MSAVPIDDANLLYSSNNNAIQECLSYFLQGLGSLGFNSARPPATFNKETDTQMLITVIQRALSIISEAKIAGDDLEERNQKLSSDLKHAFVIESRNQTTLQQSEKQLLMSKEKERQMLIKLDNVQCELKVEKEKVKRLKAVLQQKIAQYQHEGRRKEQEIMQMTEQLQRALNDRKPSRPEMKILNILTRADGSRGKWRTEYVTKKQESEFMKTVMQGYETRNSQLVEENIALKETLAGILHEVESLADNHSLFKGSSDYESNSDSCSHDSGICSLKKDDSFFQMHFEAIKLHVNRLFQEKFKIIKEILSENSKDVTEEAHEHCKGKQQILEEAIKILEEELTERQKLVDEREKLLEAAATVGDLQNPYLKDGFILEEKESFRKERELFLEQRSNFKQERKAFTEAAIRLAKERRDFEECRNNVLSLHGISCGTPPQKHLPPRHSLPSTPELYHILGLSNAE